MLYEKKFQVSCYIYNIYCHRKFQSYLLLGLNLEASGVSETLITTYETMLITQKPQFKFSLISKQLISSAIEVDFKITWPHFLLLWTECKCDNRNAAETTACWFCTVWCCSLNVSALFFRCWHNCRRHMATCTRSRTLWSVQLTPTPRPEDTCTIYSSTSQYWASCDSPSWRWWQASFE